MSVCGTGTSTLPSLSLIHISLLSVVILIFGRSIISAIVTEAQVEVIQIAYQYLSIMVVCLFMLYLLFLYRSTLQGMGATFTPMLSGFLELVARIGCAFLLPVFMGYTGVFPVSYTHLLLRLLSTALYSGLPGSMRTACSKCCLAWAYQPRRK